MRCFADRVFDIWDDLGIWSQYGLTVVGVVGLMALAAELIALSQAGL